MCIGISLRHDRDMLLDPLRAAPVPARLGTMGALTEPPPDMHPVEAVYFSRLVQYVEGLYPRGWRAWPVRRLSYEELFGDDGVSAFTEGLILFAAPIGGLATVFCCAAGALTPERARCMQRWLLRWELGRAMVVQPAWVQRAVHGSRVRFAGLAVNPLTFRVHSQRTVLELSRGVHDECTEDAPAPQPWGPLLAARAARGELGGPGTPLPWADMTLQAVQHAALQPLHVCDPFPDFDHSNMPSGSDAADAHRGAPAALPDAAQHQR